MISFWICGVVAALLALSAVDKIMTLKKLEQRYSGVIAAEVVYVRVVGQNTRNSSCRYEPTIKYSYGNEIIEQEVKLERDFVSYKQGQIVDIRVNPNKPNECYIITDKSIGSYITTIVASVFIFALGIGIGMLMT